MTTARFFSPRSLALGVGILLAALSRLVPHPPNFTPIAAMALFGAALLADRRLAVLAPLLGLLLSDLVIEALYRLGLSDFWGFYADMGWTYAAFLLVALIGLFLRGRTSVLTVAGATLAGSVVFFVVSNFGVWASTDLYPPTAAGLAECYVLAIPFFGNALLGNGVYATILFGGFALAARVWPVLREATLVPAAQNA